MPENVQSEPLTTGDLHAIHARIWVPRTTPLELSARSLDLVRKRMDDEILKIKDLFPEVPEARLEAAINVAYGYTGGQDKNTLIRNPEKTPTQYEKEASARIGHALTHAVIYASSPDATPQDQEVIASYLKVAQNLKNNRLLETSTTIADSWIGLKREIAIARTLLEDGYEVYLPDYNQDPLEVPEDENEVLQFDVKSGVDIFALKDGKIILIDAKGINNGQSQEKPTAVQPPRLIDIGFEWNPLLRKTLIESNPKETYRLVLGIPRASDAFQVADFTSGKQTPAEALRNFGRLKGDQSFAIKIILDSLKPGKINYKLA